MIPLSISQTQEIALNRAKDQGESKVSFTQDSATRCSSLPPFPPPKQGVKGAGDSTSPPQQGVKGGCNPPQQVKLKKPLNLESAKV